MKTLTSVAATTAAQSDATSNAFFELLTISHPLWTDNVRIVNNTVGIVSRGLHFTPWVFALVYPEEDGKSPLAWSISIDNALPNIRMSIAQAVAPPTVLIELVLKSAPDVVEFATPAVLTLRDVRWDSSIMTGTLKLDGDLDQILPGHKYGPVEFAGIF